jgi:hypothetical protein
MVGIRGRSEGKADVSQKVSPEVMARVESATEDSREIPVIVTLVPGTDPAVLEPKGIRIGRVMENIPVVAGTVDGADVTGLAELPEVERVEYDGQMYAL